MKENENTDTVTVLDTNNNETNGTTEVVCIIDRSTSIRSYRLVEKTIEGFNSFLNEQKEEEGEANLTMCLFDGGNEDSYEIRYDGVNINDIPELNNDTYSPRGMTAMYDAIGVTIDKVKTRINNMDESDRPAKVVFLIMTDGEENSSKEYDRTQVANLIQECEDELDWAFVFIGANIDTMKEGGSMNVKMGNTMSYASNEDSLGDTYAKMSSTVSSVRGMSAQSFKLKKANLINEDENENNNEETPNPDSDNPSN